MTGLYNFAPWYFRRREAIGFVSLCLIRMSKVPRKGEVFLDVSGRRIPLKLYLGGGIPLFSGLRLNVCKALFRADEFSDASIQNKVTLLDYAGDDGEEIHLRMPYDAFNRAKGRGRVASVLVLPDSATTLFFRQTEQNSLVITVRNSMPADARRLRALMWVARWVARFTPQPGVTLLYEKEAAGYEESAKAVYEKLIDAGYGDAYFILDAASPHRELIEKKYLPNIVDKDSFRHYLLFFRCKKFVGTEVIQHAIGLRAASASAIRKQQDIRKGKADFAFLQHGVVCMLSFGMALREGLHKTGSGLRRVVVSSHQEARHFREYAGYDEEDIYLSGLPKFDYSVLNPGADRILIMPTWRRWEANLMRQDAEKTRYFQLIQDMLTAIPKELRTKVMIKPHPLFLSYLGSQKTVLDSYFVPGLSYDEALKETVLLITDYSSIATDAFFRGANVLFYWEQLEECLAAYGEGASLILDRDTIFGEVCYSTEELEELIPKYYLSPQPEEYRKRYRQVVEFDDRKNTERVIELLRKDGFVR